MNRFVLPLALLACAAVAPLVPACSSNGATSSADAGGDSSIGPDQLEGQPCDPTLTNACLQAPCSAVECDPISQTCLVVPMTGPCEVNPDSGYELEAGPDANTFVSSGCTSNSDCPTIAPIREGGAPIVLVCAFSAYDGCGASGSCEVADPPAPTKDGAPEVACGCDGQAVSYVTDTTTSEPVASPGPCIPPPVDAGPDAADAGIDAPADTGTDAADATTDAADDAPLDAPTDG